jgi:hypothetical protein
MLLRSPFPEATSRLVSLLERHSEHFPPLAEELAQQRALAELLAEHHRRGECALSAWRAALSLRWEREVDAQRAYSAVQRELAACYGGDPAYAQLIAPAHPGGASTPSDLLHEVRRLEASLELLAPRPPFAAAAAARLRAAASALAAAIERSARCEAERRSVVSEQRMVANLYERAYDRARRQLARCLGEQAVALPSFCPDAAPLT